MDPIKKHLGKLHQIPGVSEELEQIVADRQKILAQFEPSTAEEIAQLHLVLSMGGCSDEQFDTRAIKELYVNLQQMIDLEMSPIEKASLIPVAARIYDVMEEGLKTIDRSDDSTLSPAEAAYQTWRSRFRQRDSQHPRGFSVAKHIDDLHTHAQYSYEESTWGHPADEILVLNSFVREGEELKLYRHGDQRAVQTPKGQVPSKKLSEEECRQVDKIFAIYTRLLDIETQTYIWGSTSGREGDPIIQAEPFLAQYLKKPQSK